VQLRACMHPFVGTYLPNAIPGVAGVVPVILRSLLPPFCREVRHMAPQRERGAPTLWTTLAAIVSACQRCTPQVQRRGRGFLARTRQRLCLSPSSHMGELPPPAAPSWRGRGCACGSTDVPVGFRHAARPELSSVPCLLGLQAPAHADDQVRHRCSTQNKKASTWRAAARPEATRKEAPVDSRCIR